MARPADEHRARRNAHPTDRRSRLFTWKNDTDRAERRVEYRATFLAQCHATGYDNAKCDFFLTMTEQGGGAAARQAAFDAVTTPK